MLGLRVRIIRRDLVPRCGPLGGIYTALKTSAADAELFLACDMPFVSPELMEQLVESWRQNQEAAFFRQSRMLRTFPTRNPEPGTRNFPRGAAGFPLVLPRRLLPVVERQILKGEFSLQELAKAVRARILPTPRGREWELFNVNTPEDWKAARQRYARPFFS